MLGDALVSILPGLNRNEDNFVVDTWEDEEEEGLGGTAAFEGATRLNNNGRLMRLQCVIWPQIPFETRQLCRERAPSVFINPSPGEVQANRLLCWQCNSELDLDAEWLRGVAGYDSAGSERDGEQGKNKNKKKKSATTEVVHIAERFRRAYDSQDKRLKKQSDWLWRKATREVLQSGGERVIRQWEHDF